MTTSKSFQSKLALVSLLALSFTVFLGKSYEVLLRGIDSNIHAAVAVNVTSQGVTPQLPMPFSITETPQTETGRTLDPRVYFNDHPFFPFWLNGWIMKALGPSAWSARFLTALSSVGCVLLTFLIGAALDSTLLGITSALFLIFTRDFILTSATMSLDTMMIFFILLTFFLWLKKKWLLLGIFSGIGLWVKTPVVLLVFPTAFIVRWIQGNLKKEAIPLIKAGVLACAVGSLVWLATGMLGGWPIVEDYWVRQVWGTAVEGRQLSYGRDWWMFPRTIKTGFLPGFPFLLFALVKIFFKKSWKTPAVLVPLSAVLILGTILTSMRFTLGHYYTPIFPFLALLASQSVLDFLRKRENGFYAAIGYGTPVLLSILLSCPISFGPEAFLSLKRFMPFIQTYGSCKDPVLLIQGGEPIGSSLDYQLVLNFYTNHPVRVADCGQASEMIRTTSPVWVIVSDENFHGCLTSELRDRYSTRFLAGNLYLLAQAGTIPENGRVDLTPLERELRPSVDCVAPAYSQDRYHRYSAVF